MSNLGPETLAMIALFDWIRLQPLLLPYAFHIANERKTSPQSGAILKRMGVRSGVSDVMFAIPKGRWHGLFLELKAGKNKPTKNQEQFMLDMTSQGYYCVWCVGFDAAVTEIDTYLGL
jgi:hypothetical protein